MANHKSAKKRTRQTQLKEMRINSQAFSSKIKTIINKFN